MCVPFGRDAGIVKAPVATPVKSAVSVPTLTGLDATHTSAVVEGLRPKTRSVTDPPAFIVRTAPVPEEAAVTSVDVWISSLKVPVLSTLRILC